jgi:hypothetical protein
MICRLCLGEPLGFIERHEDMFDFQKTLEHRLPIVEKLAIFTEMNVWIRTASRIPFLNRMIPSKQDRGGIGAILGVS